jgi:Protein of unknown function (DUF3592)
MKIAGVIVSIIGVVLLGVGGYLFVKEKLFLLSAQQATAIVTGNERYTYESNDYGTQHYYCSDFQFQTKDGGSISLSEDDSTDMPCTDLDMPPDYQTGQKVPVFYDARDPAHTVQISKSVSLDYDGAMIVLVVGAFLLLLGLGLFWIGWWRSTKSATSRAGQR